jgi:hypothetical protein
MTDSVLLASIRLVEDGTLTLSDGADPELVFLTKAYDISFHEGRVYSGVAPGGSVVAAPFYFVLRPFFSWFDESIIRNPRISSYYLVNSRASGTPPAPHFRDLYLLQILLAWILVAPLFASFLARFHRRLLSGGCNEVQATVIVLAAGLGSMALYYGAMYSAQSLACLLAWHAILLLYDGTGRSTGVPSRISCMVAGLLGGAAIAIDYPSAVLLTIALLFAFPGLNNDARLRVLASSFAVLGLLALYQFEAFGSPFDTPYHHRFWVSSKIVTDQGLAEFEQGITPVANPPRPKVMAQLCFGLYKGFFIYSPILLLGLLGHVAGLRETGPRRLLHVGSLLVFLSYLTLNSTLGAQLEDYGHHFWGGLSNLWGPRHLLPVIPVLAWGILRLDWRRAWVRRSCFVLLSVSCLFNVLGAMYSHVMMSTYVMGPELRIPIAYAFALLFRSGPRAPLLDSYGMHPAGQALVLFTLATVSILILRPRVTSRSAASEEAGGG